MTYKDLANFDFISHDYNMTSLKVTISKLRSKLVGCQILAKKGMGYYLVIKYYGHNPAKILMDLRSESSQK